TAGIHRALRVGTDDLHLPARHLFEVATGAGDGAAGADARDEMGHRALGIAPDLRAGGLVVAVRAVRVGVLIRFPGALDLAGQPVGDAVVAVRVLRRHRRRAHHHFGAVGPQHIALVLADLVRADEYTVVTALLSHQRQTDTGVPRGGFDNGPAGLQVARLLGRLDHLHRDTVLGATAGVQILDLGRHQPGPRGSHRVQSDQRGVADEVHDMIRDAHTPIVAEALPGASAWSATPAASTARKSGGTTPEHLGSGTYEAAEARARHRFSGRIGDCADRGRSTGRRRDPLLPRCPHPVLRRALRALLPDLGRKIRV